MSDYYVSSVKNAALSQWAASTAYTVGQIRRNLTGGNARVFRCEVAGTSGASEPSWPSAVNATVSDNGITWRNVTGVGTYGWGAAAADSIALTAAATVTLGDNVYVDSAHVQTAASTFSLGGQARWFSVNAAGSVPPVPADYQRGASLTVTGANNINLTDGMFCGFDFIAGSNTATAANIAFTANSSYTFLLDCLLHLNNTGVSAIIGSATLGGNIEFDCNTKVRFGGNAGQRFNITLMSFTWRNGNATDSVQCPSGSWPTTLFVASSGYGSTICKCIGVDLTAFAGTSYASPATGHVHVFEQCRLDKSKCDVGGTIPYGPAQPTIQYLNCTYTGENKLYDLMSNDRVTRLDLAQNVSRATGAKNAVSTYSFRGRLVTTNMTGGLANFPVSRKYNKATGVAKIAKLFGISFTATRPLASMVHVDFLYNTEANTSFINDVRSPGAFLDSSTLVASNSEDWTATAAARQNSTSYAFGDAIKVASNPGKLFMKSNTGNGISGASEPAGFATANYGDTVTDNSITWRCGLPFALEIAFTAAREGFVTMQPRFRPESSMAYHVCIDPKLEIV